MVLVRDTGGGARQTAENLATGAATSKVAARSRSAALNKLAGRFLTDFYVMVAHWVDWASRLVEDWPEDARNAPCDVAATEEAVRLAQSIAGEPQRLLPTPISVDVDQIERLASGLCADGKGGEDLIRAISSLSGKAQSVAS